MLGLAVALLLGTLWFLNAIARSPFGRVMRAVREDDVVAATLGKHVLWARVRIFAIGGAFIGLAGSLHAFYYQYIDPTQFSNIVIAYAFMAVIAGGRGAHRGTIWGAAVVMLLLEGSRFVKDLIPGSIPTSSPQSASSSSAWASSCCSSTSRRDSCANTGCRSI